MKSRIVFFALMVGAAILAGCSLISGASKPTTVISSPPSGSAYNEGDNVAIQSTSLDSTGVARVELTVDGAVVRNDTPPSTQTNFSLVQTWKAIQGAHTIIVRAYNAAGIASDPAAISIQVNPSVAQNVPTPTPAQTVVPTSVVSTGSVTGQVLLSGGPSQPAANATVALVDAPTFSTLTGNDGSYTLSNIPAGAHVISASTNQGSSNPVNVNVPAGGSAAANLVIFVALPTPTVAPPPPPPSCSGTPNIASFTASPNPITAGHSTTLSWGLVSNADSAEIDHGIGGVKTPGSKSVAPGSTTTYTLTARCGSNKVTAQVTVTVNPAPPPSPSVTQVLKQISIAAGGNGQAIANCPSGTKVTGGGFASGASMVVYSNAMEGNGWESAAQNNGASTAGLNAYAICASNLSGAVSQVFTQVSVGAGTTGQAVINCPSGNVLTGGGYASNSQQEVYSDAIQGSNGWESASKNKSGSPQLLNAYAMCYSGAGASSSFVLKQVSVGAGSNGDAQADCPSGMLATGGGYAAGPGLIVFTTLQEGNGWRSYASNTSGGSLLLNSYAICTHF